MIQTRVLVGDLYHFEFMATRDEDAESAYYFHTHQGIEILYVYEGSGQVILDDQFYAVGPRTLLLFKPFQLHYLRMDVPPRYTCSLIKIRPAFLDACASVLPRTHDLISGFLTETNSQQIFQLDEVQHHQMHEQFRHFNTILHNDVHQLQDEAAILFLLHFFVDLVTNIMPHAATGQKIKPLRTTQRVTEVLKWVDQHYKQSFTLDHMAEELHMSVNYMSKLFRQQTGKTIVQYVAEKRLEQARVLLHSTLSVEEISEQTGFNSPSYLIRLFKQRYGVPPHQYRLQAANRYKTSE